MDFLQKLARARTNVDENYDKEWAQRINEALKPCQICEARQNGELGDLIDGLFEEASGKTGPPEVKEYIRDWLLASDWDRNSPPPELPSEVVAKTREKYIEACERITGAKFAWK